MIYLLLAVICSVLISLLMRLSKQHIKNSIAMFLANYIVCSTLAKIYIGDTAVFSFAKISYFAILLGIMCGILFLGSFFMLNLNIRRNGVVLSAVFMRLGVLVPIIVAMIFYGEMPKPLQTIGFILAVIAILLIYFEKNDAAGKDTSKWLLILLFLVGGAGDCLPFRSGKKRSFLCASRGGQLQAAWR